MKTKTLIAIIFLILGVAAVAAVVFGWKAAEPSATTPSATETPELHYTQTSLDEIEVFSPQPGDVITSPFTIRGRAVGSWFFEASAPVILTDWDGRIIAERYVTAQGDWMTTEKVPFEGTLEFQKPAYGANGFLILRNDNPSGLPENDKAVEIPIRFE